MSGDAPRDDADAFWKANPKESTEEAEIGLLGAALADNTGAAAKDLFGVSPDDFSSPHCAAVARAIAASMNGAPAPDGIAVAMKLREQGEATALSLVRDQLLSWHTGANSALYASRIRYFANRRREARIRARLGATRGAAEQDKIRGELDAFLALEKEEQQSAPKPASSWDLVDLDKEPPEPDAQQFVHRLFVRPSFNIVFGPAQAGKSWAVMGLCLDAVTGGGKFLGCEDLDIFPLHNLKEGDRDEVCLWVFGSEDTRGRARRRADILRQTTRDPLQPGRFIIASPPSGLSIHHEDGWRWLLEEIERYNPSLLVLDTIASLTGHTLDVNDGAAVMPFIGRINALRAEKNLVVFALHHTRKGSSDPKKATGDKADAMLGSSAWRGLTEGVLMLDARDGNTQDITVVSIKAKDIPNPIPSLRVCLENPGGRFRVLDREETAPEREAVATTGRGRPSKFSADAVLGLQPRFPAGLGWNETMLREGLGISRALWFDRHEAVFADLVARGCSLVDGSLRWPVDGPSTGHGQATPKPVQGGLEFGASPESPS